MKELIFMAPVMTMNSTISSLLSNGNPNQPCIDLCMKCSQLCQECITLCLQEPDVGKRANCIKTLQDCSEICSTASCFMSRGSGSIKDICNVCATICDKCAAECNMFTDPHCKACAEVCSECAETCRNM